ncbi:MAG: hypothetical protein JWN86_764 [Planctomycetota bacterium]|nr:hypothetical protein [Planctomycetota bacterium]
MIANLKSSPRPATCIGLDLAGVEHRETGAAVLRDGRLVRLTTLGSDVEVVRFVLRHGRLSTVAINAPLTRPLGRCCLDDDCRCRHDPGTRSRQLERDLGRMGVPALATALIKVLARRGARIAMALRVAGIDPLEVYPFATLRLLGLPWAKKKTRDGRALIHDALRPLVPGLDHPAATEHEIDAVVCALTARFWREGMARNIGDPAEGLMVVPDRGRLFTASGRLRRPVSRPVLPCQLPSSLRANPAGTGRRKGPG